MSGEGEFIGDIAAGALAAATAKAGIMATTMRQACLNCGTVLLTLVASTS